MTDPSAIRRLIEGVTEGPWRVFEQEITDKEHAKRELIELVDGTSDFRPVMVYVADENFELAPAITGCGPRSIANARFIAAARTLVPQLLDEVERLTSAIDVLSGLLTVECEQNVALRARIAELEAGMGERK